MGTQSQTDAAPHQAKVGTTQRMTYELEQQCLRVLRCSAAAFASSPGGLRFKAGTRPWLDALTQGRSGVSLSSQHGG